MFRLLPFIIAPVFIISCQNCICVPSDGLKLGMVSFDSTDIDTIIIRKFGKGNNFNQLIDTSQWDRAKVIFHSQNDTFQMGAFLGGILLKSNFDYQVFIPALSRNFNITEMNEPQLEGNCSGKVMCVNAIVSCKLNGSTTPVQINSDILYLKK